jgi:hypothetical protein
MRMMANRSKAVGKCQSRARVAACLAIALLLASAPVALGDGPTGAGSGGTGISTAGDDNSGLTTAEVTAKLAQYEQWLRTGVAPKPEAKQGAAKLTVLSRTVTTAATDSALLVWWPGFHQKTTYYCLVATVQSMAYFDIEAEWYYDLGSGSIKGAQDKIYSGYKNPDGTKWAGIKAATCDASPCGADDAKALAWLNGQYKHANMSWHYAAVTPSSASDFNNYVSFDVGASEEPTYVRVDLSTKSGTGYMWYQGPNKYGHHIDHATLVVGYNTTKKTDTSYDPFTHTLSTGACSTSYDPKYDVACNWTIPQKNDYIGMDRINDTPMWI